MSHKLQDTVFYPEVGLHKTDLQQLLLSEEKVPHEQHEWSPLQDQEEPPEEPHIKEEQEELWSSQEGEQPQGLEEADISNFIFTSGSVKSEEDEEQPWSSLLHQRQTEQVKTKADGEDCEGPEPVRNFNPDSHLQPATDEETSHPSEPETDDSCDWEKTREPQTGSNHLQNNNEPLNDMKCSTGKASVISTECTSDCDHKRYLQKHNGIQIEVKPFSCSVCGKRYHWENCLRTHMKLHSEEKRFSCSVCKKTFQRRGNVARHMRIHTGEKPFSCSFCGIRFTLGSTLTSHIRVHTGEKPFNCSVCKTNFGNRGTLSKHMRMHTGEKPFSCSVCGKRFAQKTNLTQHLTVHTDEKPFICSVCGKGFAQKTNLRRHLTVHTGEKPFSCSVCNKMFTRLAFVRKHKCVGEGSRTK